MYIIQCTKYVFVKGSYNCVAIKQVVREAYDFLFSTFLFLLFKLHLDAFTLHI